MQFKIKHRNRQLKQVSVENGVLVIKDIEFPYKKVQEALDFLFNTFDMVVEPEEIRNNTIDLSTDNLNALETSVCLTHIEHIQTKDDILEEIKMLVDTLDDDSFTCMFILTDEVGINKIKSLFT